MAMDILMIVEQNKNLYKKILFNKLNAYKKTHRKKIEQKKLIKVI